MSEHGIPYYVVIKGHGYWRPTKRMRDLGWKMIRCGPDGVQARAIAVEWNERWQAQRKGADRKDREPALNQPGYVYFLLVGDRIKIGFSTNPFARTGALSTGVASKPDMLFAVRGSRKDEKQLHARFDAYRSSGEWFVAAKPIRMTMMRSAAAGEIVHDRASEGQSVNESINASETLIVLNDVRSAKSLR